MKNLYIKTYGCQMNVYDSERMIDLLAPHGFQEVQEAEHADLIILNTCHIREKASEKIHAELGKIKKNDDMMVVVAGCVAQAEGQEIIKRSPVVDIVVGPQSYHTLPELIEKVKRQKSWVINLDFNEHEKFDNLFINEDRVKHSAFLSIQEGCDKFCHFCVVPYTRGAEYSRNVNEVYRDVLLLASKGCKEVTLLGQNVNAYHGVDDHNTTYDLAGLMEYIAGIDGIERIRYTTSHPKDMNQNLINAHKNISKVMPYIHLPVQSGSDNMLKAMNRKHTRDFYFQIIDDLRGARPDIAISSDFIVGYPGETDDDFNDTLDLIKRVAYCQAYSFKYSKRPGTPAANLPNQIPEHVKDDRLQTLQQLLNKQQKEFNESTIGMEFDILLDKPGKHSGQIIGKSPYMQSVVVHTKAPLLGTIVKVRITNARQNSIDGIIM